MKAVGDGFLQPAMMEKQQQQQQEQQENHEAALGCNSSSSPPCDLSSTCLSTLSTDAATPVDLPSPACYPVPIPVPPPDAASEDGVKAGEPNDGNGPKVYSKRRASLSKAPSDRKSVEPSTMTSDTQGTDDEDDDVLTLSGFVKKTRALARRKAAKARSQQALRAFSSGAEPLENEAARNNSVGRGGIGELGSKEGTCEREDEGQDAADSDVPDDDYEGVGRAEGSQDQGQSPSAKKNSPATSGLLDSNVSENALKDQVRPTDHASISGTKRHSKPSSKPSKRSRIGSRDEGTVKGHAKDRSRKGGKRAPRQVRKRRHDDMAYEGDLEWDALLNPEQASDWSALSEKDRFGRCRSRGGQPFSSESFPGEVAAIAAGLKARAPGPSERIHFKETLKRRGGLQEYLDCRNKILELWEKDVKRILAVEDCIMDLCPTPDGSSRPFLIHEIHEFLEIHGCINIGLAVKREDYLLSKDDKNYPAPSLIPVPQASPSLDQDGSLVDDAEKEAAFILGQIRGEPEKTSCTIQIPGPTENGPSEIFLVTVKTEVGDGASSAQDKQARITSTEGGIVPMDIDVDSIPCSEGLLSYAVEGTSGQDEVPVDLLERASGDVMSATVGQHEHISGSSFGALHCRVNGEQQQEAEGVQSLRQVGSEPEQYVSLSGGDDGVDFRSAEVLQCLRKDALKVATGVVHHSALNDIPSSNNGGSTQEAQKKSVIVVGAGPAGLTAARHLQRMSFNVVVLEARDRVGGRVYTDRSTFSAPVDLGASIITGVEADFAAERRADPSALLCKQLGLELTTLSGDCPLYDSVTGLKVPGDLDATLEAEYNGLLDDTVALVAHNGEAAMRMSLGEGLEHLLQRRWSSRQVPADLGNSGSGIPVSVSVLRNSVDMEGVDILQPSELSTNQGADSATAFQDDTLHPVGSDFLQEENPSGGVPRKPTDSVKKNGCLQSESQGSGIEPQVVSQLERRIMDWHFANLEYGCAAELSQVSLPYWNQDDVYGGFGGAHCMIKGGYSSIMEALRETSNVKLGKVVTQISYSGKEGKDKGEVQREVMVHTEEGEVFVADAVLITIPLGCLKAETIQFKPLLPDWKTASVKRLGFGLLNKLVMEFPAVFWDETVDYFGAAAESTEVRGKCFMFWNLKRTSGFPILVALVVGKASYEGEKGSKSDMLGHALDVLRKLFGEEKVPEPKASALTSWGSDPFSRGAYSYVALGASGEDYDILARPVENCLFFAGEGTCKEHPDTVGGAMISGLREAIRIFNILENRGDSTAEAEAMAAEQRQTDSERNEVRDMVKRLSAAELSNALRADGGPLHGEQKPLSRSDLLKDMFGRAKTTAGRLFLAKEMLQLPASSLRGFAGTKLGLTLLNNWILDSMGKDGTQLLRMCVRLLLLVATDLICIRQSGIGRTVKEKVWVHTSRDIRAVAGQLVKMWIDVYNKEKATYGTPKPPKKQQLGGGSKKAREKEVKHLSTSAKNPTADTSAIPEAKSTSTNGGSPGSQSKQEFVDDIQLVTDLDAGGDFGNLGDVESRDRGLSEMEAAAFAAAEAAQAAARAAAEAYAKAEAERIALPVLPKIVSFHKFSKQEQLAVKEDALDWKRKKWSDGGKAGHKLLYSPSTGALDVLGVNKTKNSTTREHKVFGGDRAETPRATAIPSARSKEYTQQVINPERQTPIAAMETTRHDVIVQNQAESSQVQAGDGHIGPRNPAHKTTAVANEAGGLVEESHDGGKQAEVGQAQGSSDDVGNLQLPVHVKPQDDHVKESKVQHQHLKSQQEHSRSQHDHSRPHHHHSRSQHEHQKEQSRSQHDQSRSQHYHSRPQQNHSRSQHDHSRPQQDHSSSQHDHSRPQDHSRSQQDHSSTQQDHSRSQQDHPKSQEHPKLQQEHPKLQQEHPTSQQDISKTQEDISRSQNDHNLKKAVAEYIGHLLMPLYKAKKILKDDYKAILRSATAKVMERRSGSEVQVEDVSEFLNVKRKNKIRSLIDKYIEKYLGGQSHQAME